jgi:hypothetical protein
VGKGITYLLQEKKAQSFPDDHGSYPKISHLAGCPLDGNEECEMLAARQVARNIDETSLHNIIPLL